ncbi:MAG TPA: DUF3662 domain-containing protein, partial [Thermoflexales bacterium]|nr:DUF3662 domain-containing protein [Thermoflexales bacterium]
CAYICAHIASAPRIHYDVMSRGLDDLNRQLIEAALARALRERIGAREAARELGRAIDDAFSVGPGGERLAPNHFWITLNAQDLVPLEYHDPKLPDSLAEAVRQIVAQKGFRADMAPRVMLRGAPEAEPGTLHVTARWIPPDLPQGPAESAPRAPLPRRPFLIVDGRRQVTLDRDVVRLGRSRDSDVVVDDRRVSRHHLELRWQADIARFLAVDNDSTGGTRLNGYPIKQCALEAGDVISLGGVDIIYGEEFALSSTTGSHPAAGATATEAPPEA